MSLVFKQILTEGISQLSYLIGDDGTGTAAVVDPRPDVDIYVALARKHELAITHIFETHIHADFMSGSRELAERLGNAVICVSEEGGAEYAFEHQGIEDGQRFAFGDTVLIARFTPGHTPEHMSYLIADMAQEDMPWGVLSGDSLFVGSAGRPDLLGDEATDELATQMYDTLYKIYLQLDGDVLLFPCHGAGSACGANIGDRPQSTLGREKRTNQFLQFEGKAEEFKKFVVEGAPHAPEHYSHLKKVNGNGPLIQHGLPRVPGLTSAAFKEAAERGDVQLVDARHMLSFGGGHIPGALNIGGQAEMSVWAGEMLDYDRPILLVLDQDTQLEEVVRLLFRTGFTHFAGYLVGGMTAWENAGYELKTLPQMDVHAVKAHGEKIQLLDVRSDSEWSSGHMPGAMHQYVAEMDGHLDQLDKQNPVALYCNSGYRASLAASLLQRHGFDDVRNVPGSWMAWMKADYPVEK